MPDRVVLDTRKLDEILRELDHEASKIVNKRGLKITSDWAVDVRFDTGAFRNSILANSKLVKPLLFIAKDAVTYGIFNELGTHKMAAKPSLSTAVRANEKPFIQDFVNLFKRF